MKLTPLILGLSVIPHLFAADTPEIEDGFERVTCASTVKLTNKDNGHRLHSHGVSYGSGSGQQSVTGFSAADDGNSFWMIEASSGKYCSRGEPVACGSTVRLRHTNTKSYLHSHNHKSPLSNQQEVSCYDGQDAGDDWKVECLEKGDKYWIREKPIQLVHQETNSYLSSFQQHQFGQPIPGQLEVACAKGASKNSVWMAQEGVYFASSV